VIKATTQPCDGDFGDISTTAGRNAMMADAMSRATAGSEPNFQGAPDDSPTTDWTTPTPSYSAANKT
jgi:hypothetical protein